MLQWHAGCSSKNQRGSGGGGRGGQNPKPNFPIWSSGPGASTVLAPVCISGRPVRVHFDPLNSLAAHPNPQTRWTTSRRLATSTVSHFQQTPSRPFLNRAISHLTTHGSIDTMASAQQGTATAIGIANLPNRTYSPEARLTDMLGAPLD